MQLVKFPSNSQKQLETLLRLSCDDCRAPSEFKTCIGHNYSKAIVRPLYDKGFSCGVLRHVQDLATTLKRLNQGKIIKQSVIFF